MGASFHEPLPIAAFAIPAVAAARAAVLAGEADGSACDLISCNGMLAA